MTDTVVTLKQRYARKLARMTEALAEIDALLAAYARQQGGRFIRYGRLRQHSDVDIIADFPAAKAVEAASYAQDVCFARDLVPDVRPAIFVSEAFKAAAERDGIVLP